MATKDVERKKLQKLSRVELLELLLAQTREMEMLRQQLDKANAALSDRRLRVLEAGDLAHAVLEVNDVMNAAQRAAEQYLDNIAAMKSETERRSLLLIKEAQEEAQRIREAAMLDREPTKGTAEEILAELDQKIRQSGE